MNATRRPFAPSVRQLRAFRAVYQLGKLSAAAEQLALSQSAVSVLIRQLEEGLGARLFDRTTRSLRPTAAAVEALAVVERILRDVDALGTGLRDLGALRRGRVAVAVTPTLGEILLPAVMKRFAKLHPGIHVMIDDCAPEHFVERIVAEQVDFGLGTPEGAAADVDTEKMVGDWLALVCRPEHPLASRRQVRWSDLAGMPVITVRPGYGIRSLIDGTAARAGVALEVRHEVAFLSTALWMTQCGLGCSIMPSAYARNGAYPELVVQRLLQPTVSRDISLVTRRGRLLSPAAQAFAQVMRSMLRGPARRQVSR
jgi:DNA-binding transcriptional LysR family regulator